MGTRDVIRFFDALEARLTELLSDRLDRVGGMWINNAKFMLWLSHGSPRRELTVKVDYDHRRNELEIVRYDSIKDHPAGVYEVNKSAADWRTIPMWVFDDRPVEESINLLAKRMIAMADNGEYVLLPEFQLRAASPQGGE